MGVVYGIYLVGSLYMRVRCENIVNHYIPEEEKIDPIGDVLRGANMAKDKLWLADCEFKRAEY